MPDHNSGSFAPPPPPPDAGRFCSATQVLDSSHYQQAPISARVKYRKSALSATAQIAVFHARCRRKSVHSVFRSDTKELKPKTGHHLSRSRYQSNVLSLSGRLSAAHTSALISSLYVTICSLCRYRDAPRNDTFTALSTSSAVNATQVQLDRFLHCRPINPGHENQ